MTLTPRRVSFPERPNNVEARIFLQPIAAPSVLGYFALGSALIVFGLWEAQVLGPTSTAKSFFQFLLLFAGVGQFAAAMWSFKARDAVAASVHGVWGGFWLGFGLLWLMITAGSFPVPPLGATFEPFGQWFMYMGVITLTIAFAALARSPGQFVLLVILAAGAALSAVGFITGSSFWQVVAGWDFTAAAAGCFYTAATYMVNTLYGMVILPYLTWAREENRIGARPTAPTEFPQGDPGVKVGQ
ncbi:MAG TPA: GPR1/FUN34/YaaH family transporter [Acidimicrobiales bacterium]|nr:GPR1/FUN34/YaaH family transporter [Acidimicrobiales bacterium]